MNILFKIVFYIIIIIYPFIIYFFRDDESFKYIVLLLIITWVFRIILQHNKKQRIFSICIILFLLLILLIGNMNIIYWYPVYITSLMFIIFAVSILINKPIIEYIARIHNPNLSIKGVIYTRKVTVLWCIFFVLNGGITTFLIKFNLLKLWAIYTGIISYIIMGIIILGEWVFRKYILKIK